MPENGTINGFSNFLLSFAALARSAWTEFDLKLMGVGLGIIIISIICHILVFVRVHSQSNAYGNKTEKSSESDHLQIYVAFFLVAVRAVSFLSNSYICEFCTLPYCDLFQKKLFNSAKNHCIS